MKKYLCLFTISKCTLFAMFKCHDSLFYSYSVRFGHSKYASGLEFR